MTEEITLTQLEEKTLRKIAEEVMDFGNLDVLTAENVQRYEACAPYGGYKNVVAEKAFRGVATSLQAKGLIKIDAGDPEQTWVYLNPDALPFVTKEA